MGDSPNVLPDRVSDVSSSSSSSSSSEHDKKAATSDQPTKATQLTNVAPPSECHSHVPHTALQIAENKAALPAPPAKICKKAAASAAGPVKDFIYKVPPPLPEDHPSKSAAKYRRRCSPCARGMVCVCSLVLAIVLLLAIALLLFYLIAQPRLPKYDIENLTISELKFTNRTSREGGAVKEYVSAAMAMTITGRNPNKRMGVSYEGMEASVQYEGVMISEGAMGASMYQSAGNTTTLQLMLHADMVSLPGDIATSMKKSLPSLPLHVDTIVHVALKLGAWTSSHVTLHVACSVQVTFPATSSATSAFSKSCDLKVASKRVPFLLLFASK